VTFSRPHPIHARSDSPRDCVRTNASRSQTPALLRGQIFSSDGQAKSPIHPRKPSGRLYHYYVSQSVLKGSAADGPAIARISAGEIEGIVIVQLRGLLRQQEIVLGVWRAARLAAPGLTEDEARLALQRLDPLWEELFLADRNAPRPPSPQPSARVISPPQAKVRNQELLRWCPAHASQVRRQRSSVQQLLHPPPGYPDLAGC
jgi:hypothetical protein